MGTDEVLAAAKRAKAAGAQRFCMGAAWRSPKDRDMDMLCDMVRGVSDLGLETCMTLGMLSPEQVARLKAASLDFYNHNIDTSPAYYAQIASTRKMEDRLDTVEQVRKGGIKVCGGGILGMGEAEEDRIAMLVTLATLPLVNAITIAAAGLGSLAATSPTEWLLRQSAGAKFFWVSPASLPPLH